MALYQYASGSLIDSAQILTNETGGHRAYLHAAPGASSEQLRHAKQVMRGKNWTCVPTVQDGKPVLEVRGFKKSDVFLAEIQELRLAKSPQEVIPAQGDKRGRSQVAKHSTLKLTGITYILGDIAFFYSKINPLRHSWKTDSKADRFFGMFDIVAGVGYLLGSLSLARYGSRDQSLNTIEAATRKVERHAREQGIEITPETSIAFVNRKPHLTMWQKLDRVFDKFPSETLNSIYVVVGLALAGAALYRGTKPIDKNLPADLLMKAKHYKNTDLIDVGLGAITAASALTGVFVKETKRVEGDPKRPGIGGVIDWIREKPLRATGIGYFAATAVHAFSTKRLWKGGSAFERKYLRGRIAFIGFNVIAEGLLALSSKGHGSGVKPDVSVDGSVIATTAELIFRQPTGKRNQLVNQFAGYIASNDVLGGKAEAIAADLQTHIATLDKNPWTKHFQAGDGKAFLDHADIQPTQTASQISANDPQAPGTKISAAQHYSAGLNAAENAPKPALAM